MAVYRPVIFATGVKIINEADFVLLGVLELQWQRFYRSSDRCPGWLGHGWSVPLAVELALGYEAVPAFTRHHVTRSPLLTRSPLRMSFL
jgi:hypothetical protein